MTEKIASFTTADLDQNIYARIATWDSSALYNFYTKRLAEWSKDVAFSLATFAMPVVKQTKGFEWSESDQFTKINEFHTPSGKETDIHRWEVAFPLDPYEHAFGFTDLFYKTATVQQFKKLMDDAESWDKNTLMALLKEALYNSANGSSVDPVTTTALTIRRAWNAVDLVTPPPNSAGTTFPAHTHFSVKSGGALAASDISLLPLNILHHDQGFDMKFFINWENVSTLAAFSSNFFPVKDRMIQYGNDQTTSTLMSERNPSNPFDYRAGVWVGTTGSYEVWVKPWAIKDYYLCADTANPEPPLGYRELEGYGGLQIGTLESWNNMHTQKLNRWIGFGTNNRSAYAVLDATNAVYTDPA